MYSKDIEEISISITTDNDIKGSELIIVSEQLKGKLIGKKEYRDKKKIGNVNISYGDGDDSEEEEYDEYEQVYVNKNSSKIVSMYGKRDIRDLPIYQIRDGSIIKVMIIIPIFNNYYIYNELSEKIIGKIIPKDVTILAEKSLKASMTVECNKYGIKVDDLDTGSVITSNDLLYL